MLRKITNRFWFDCCIYSFAHQKLFWRVPTTFLRRCWHVPYAVWHSLHTHEPFAGPFPVWGLRHTGLPSASLPQALAGLLRVGLTWSWVYFSSPKLHRNAATPWSLPYVPLWPLELPFSVVSSRTNKFSKLPSVYMVKNQLLLNSAHQHGTSHPFRCSCLFELRLPPWGRSSEQGDAALRELTGEMLIVVTVLQNDENRHLPSVSLCQVRHNSVVSLLWS